jgi:hypothetical protein
MRASQSLPNINRDPPPHLRAHAGVRPPKGGNRHHLTSDIRFGRSSLLVVCFMSIGWGVQGPGPRLLLLQNPSPTRQSNKVVAANKTNKLMGATNVAAATNGHQQQPQRAQQQHHATRIGPINGDFGPSAKQKKTAGKSSSWCWCALIVHRSIRHMSSVMNNR